MSVICELFVIESVRLFLNSLNNISGGNFFIFNNAFLKKTSFNQILNIYKIYTFNETRMTTSIKAKL